MVTLTPEAISLFADNFETELLNTVEDHPDVSTWSVAGKRRSKTAPTGEDLTWWRMQGPHMVQNYINWRTQSGWAPWVTPAGDLAVELDIVVDVPNPNREYEHEPEHTPLKMFVDAVMVSQPAKQLVIVDHKTGARTPDSDLQLGVYRLGIQKKYGVDVKLGAYWMARTGNLTDVFDLARLSPDMLETWFTRLQVATAAGIFIPHPTNLCRACAMRDYCAAFGGRYKHKDPDYTGV